MSTKLSSGRIAGSAAVHAVFDVRPGGPQALPVATATIRGWGAVAGVPRTAFEIDLSSAGERVRATIDATGEGVRVKAAGTVRTLGDLLAIESATLHATSTDPAHASGGKAPVHGALTADLVASGTLRPATNLAVAGTIDGRHLRMQDLSVASLHVTIDAQRLPDRPLGNAHVQLVDLVRGDMQLGELTVDATDRIDGKLAVSVRSRPKQNPWLVDADAIVTPPAGAGRGALAPGTVAIDIQRHHVRAGNGSDWTGTTGHVEIGPERISVRDFTSASALGRLAIAGSYEHAGRRRGDLAANIDATALSLGALSTAYRGKLDAHIAVAHRGRAWDGDVQLDGTNLSFDPSNTMLEAHARAALHGARLAVTADATSTGLGSAKLALELDAPAAVTDPRAWKQLGRAQIRSGELTVRGIEVRRAAALAGLAGDYAGRIDGDFRLSPATVGGRLEAHNVVAPALHGLGGPGGVSAVLDVSQPSPSELVSALTANVEGVGQLVAQAQLAVPDRLLDPAAWSALGRGALHGASARVDNVTVDPAMLDRLGLSSELRGRLTVAVEVGEAARTAHAAIDIAALRGDPIVMPIDVHLAAAIEDRATTASLTVTTAAAPADQKLAGTAAPAASKTTAPPAASKTTAPPAASKTTAPLAAATLLELQGRLPGSIVQLFERWRSDPEVAGTTPLAATATLSRVDATRLLAVFGRTEVTAGVLDGTVELAGTLGRPTVKANLTATALKIPPGPRGKPVRTVERLALVASWDGDGIKLDLDGVESEGGALRAQLLARPAALRDGTLTVKATKFDLVPLLAFAPGPAGGAAGQLDANLRFTGLDLRTTKLAGELHLLGARVPIAPTVGTLRRRQDRRGDRRTRDQAHGRRQARRGHGHGQRHGRARWRGAQRRQGEDHAAQGVADRRRRAADLRRCHRDAVARSRAGGTPIWWSTTPTSSCPNDRGEKLKPAGAPADMTFANGQRMTTPPDEARGAGPGRSSSSTSTCDRPGSSPRSFAATSRASSRSARTARRIGLVGGIEAERGDLDLFGAPLLHRARRGALRRLARSAARCPDHPRLLRGDDGDRGPRPAEQARADDVERSGDLLAGQLLGFLLGGEPGGDPQSGSMSNTRRPTPGRRSSPTSSAATCATRCRSTSTCCATRRRRRPAAPR